jgi:hypothetical protein
MWEDHDVEGGELIMESPHRIALVWGENGAIQVGLSRGITDVGFIQIQNRNSATALSPLGKGYPIVFNSSFHNGTASESPAGFPGMQARTRADKQVELVMFAGSTFPNTFASQDPSMPEIVALTPEGFRDPNGNAPAFVTLTDGTITVTCSTTKSFQNHAVTLAEDSTLAFSGATAGMRGTILISQNATGGHTITLPANSAYQTAITLSTGPLKTDRLDWLYDGNYYYFELKTDYTIPFDTDAVTFLAAASISQATAEGVALNRLVLDLKQYDLWSNDIIEAYPLIGGTSAKHAYGLKRAGYDATFGSTVTHNSNGITGSASNTGWMSTGINVSALGLRDDIGIYAYNKTPVITANGHIFGTGGTNARFYVVKSSNRQFGSGPCSGDVNTVSTLQDVVTDAGHYWFGRTSSTAIAIAADADWTTGTNTANTAPTIPIHFLSNSDGTGSATRGIAPTNANLAFAAVTKGLTQTKYNNLRACIDNFQTALGRQNV